MTPIHIPKMPRFNEKKATEAAYIFLKNRGGEMSYLKLLKLLYLAERDFFIRTSSFISFDHPVSMDNGPVLSRIYNLIREQPEPGSDSYWRKFITQPTQDYTVKLTGEVPQEELSQAERVTIEKIFREFGKKSRWELVEFSHKLPEWVDPFGSSFPINLEDILKAAGKKPERIAAIIEEMEHQAFIESAFT